MRLFKKNILLLAFASVSLLTFAQQKNDSTPVPRPIRPELLNRVPLPRGRVSDFAATYLWAQLTQLDSIITDFEKKTTVQIAIVTLDSLMVSAKDFDEFTLAIANKWGVGQKGKNNGILIAISPYLRRIRIQNGSGIQKILSDADTFWIIQRQGLPYFRKAKYYEGTKAVLLELIRQLKQKGAGK